MLSQAASRLLHPTLARIQLLQSLHKTNASMISCLSVPKQVSQSSGVKVTSSFNSSNLIANPQIDCKQSIVRTTSSESSSPAHDHSKLWNLEKIVSASLLAVIPGAFAIQSPLLDYALAFSLVIHVHWGLEAIAVDYVRPSLFGETIPKIAVAYVYALSAVALAGLFYFNYTDVGLVQAIKMFLQK